MTKDHTLKKISEYFLLRKPFIGKAYVEINKKKHKKLLQKIYFLKKIPEKTNFEKNGVFLRKIFMVI